MFLKANIAEIFTNVATRYFNTTTVGARATKLNQYHSGGDDYCPLLNAEGLSECVGGNPADGVIVAWRDDIERKSQSGEKRIYSVKLDEDTGDAVQAAEVYLKNDGSIEITGGAEIILKSDSKVVIQASEITSEGEWSHNGNFTASHIEADDGATGTFTNSTTASSGIVTGGL